MLLPGRIYIARGPWHFADFCNIFLINIGVDQKKVSPSEFGALIAGAVPYYGKPGPSYCIRFIKRLNEGLKKATFKTKILNFSRVIHLNWLAKIELRATRGPSSQYC